VYWELMGMEMYLVLLPALQQACFWLDRTLESPPFQDVGWPCYQPDAGLTSMIWRNDVSLRLYISTKTYTFNGIFSTTNHADITKLNTTSKAINLVYAWIY